MSDVRDRGHSAFDRGSLRAIEAGRMRSRIRLLLACLVRGPTRKLRFRAARADPCFNGDLSGDHGEVDGVGLRMVVRRITKGSETSPFSMRRLRDGKENDVEVDVRSAINNRNSRRNNGAH